MKQIIIIVATIILGLLIYTMLVGDQDGSVKNATKNSLVNQIEVLNDINE